MADDFKPGDKVRCTEPAAGMIKGAIYTVESLYGRTMDGHQLLFLEEIKDPMPWNAMRFVRMSDAETIREAPYANAAQEFAEVGMLAVKTPHEEGCYHCDHGNRACICPGRVTKLSPSEAASIENTLAAEALGAPVEQDMVNLPKHYARFKIEPIRFIVENGLDWFQGNITKYVLRHDAKNGDEDLAKAERYIKQYRAFNKGDPDWWKLKT